jgi:hypothetical protein
MTRPNQEELNRKQRERRHMTRNWVVRKYEKTKNGFLMRLYRNMKSRVTGVQRAKYHLYAGCTLLSKESFYEWANNSEIFHLLFKVWEESEYDRKLTPSVDRIDSLYGYELPNMEWVTHSVNSSRGSLNRYYGDWRSDEARSR